MRRPTCNACSSSPELTAIRTSSFAATAIVAEVVSFGGRLKQRRAELGLSQAQAARELDVARTAYRLWEMEAAKPAPDRWRLISRWLGISVTTMLLADELISEAEASASTVTEGDFGRSGRDWDTASAANAGDFFDQSRTLIQDGIQSGSLTSDQADELRVVLDRLEEQRQSIPTVAWTPGELRKAFPANTQTPRAAREAVALVAGDIPSDVLETARLLTSELVTNSVKYGPPAPASIGVFVEVVRDRIRIEVSDAAAAPVRLTSESGRYGMKLVEMLAARWHTEHDGDGNVTWFELDLPAPGGAYQCERGAPEPK
jgi:transcriptional regulator with XRE-family HTH domain/anti-sigma regulatory factor (Ser/Thr protein kinase)